MLTRRAFGPTATLVLTLTIATSMAITAGHATASDPAGPGAAVTYQQNAAHDGSSQDPSFVAPFTRAWARSFDGKVGYPLIADGRAFVTVAPTFAFGNQVVALSTATGDTLWGPVDIGGHSETGSIAYDAGRVFAVDAGGEITAFEAATGEVAWSTQLPDQWMFQAPPTAAGGRVYVEGDGIGGTLYAVDQATGEVVWTAAVAGGGKSAPAVDGTGVYATFACGESFKFDLAGNLLWHHTGSCSGGAGTTPVLHDGKVWVREFAGDRPYLLDAATGQDVAGTFAAGRAPAFDGRLMATVADGGELSVSDASTGELVWRAPSPDHVLAPLIANHYVISARSDGTVEARLAQSGVLAWSGAQGSFIIQRPDEMGSNILQGMAQGDGVLLVPGENILAAFVSSGETDDATPPTVRLWPFRPATVTTAWVLARWKPVDDRSGILSSQVRTRQARIGFPLPAWTMRKERPLAWAKLRVNPGSKLCVSVRARDGLGNWSDWTDRECVRRRA